MSDLWVEASRDIEAENAETELTLAKMATASIWPFLALAASDVEFDHRLALAEPQIDRLVPKVAVREQVLESFREDFREVTALKTAVEITYQPNDEFRKNIIRRQLNMRDEAERNGEEYEPEDAEEDWRREGSLQAGDEFFHAASGTWMRVAVETPTGHNPSYDDNTPEGGPATGIESRNFASAPPDPYDPINGEYPLQPSAWTVPPDKAWVERPMNFAPYQTQASRHVAAVEWEHSDSGDQAFGFEPGTSNEIAHILRPYSGSDQYVANYYPKGFDTPEGQEQRFPVQSIEHGKSEVERRHHGSKRTANEFGTSVPVGEGSHYTDEGVETGLGPNPNFFSGGTEGATGDPQSAFPADVSLDEPNERADWYQNPQQPVSMDSTGLGQMISAKDNHGVCAGDGCGRPVYRQGNTWKHLDSGLDDQHNVLLHTSHPWVQQRLSGRRSAEYKYVKQRGDKWVITQKGTGKVLSEHDSQDDAEASFRAMMMHKHEGAQRTARDGWPYEEEGLRRQEELAEIGRARRQNANEDRARAQSADNEQDFLDRLRNQGSFHDPFDSSVRMIRRADVSSSDMGTGQQPADTSGAGTPNPPSTMLQGGPGQEAMPPQTIPNGSVSSDPFAPRTPSAPAAPAMPAMPTTPMPGVTGGRRQAAEVRGRPTAEDPTGGIGDEYTNNTWDNALKQSPRQDPQQRGINTPQRPSAPIPQISSETEGRPRPGEGEPEDDDEEED